MFYSCAASGITPLITAQPFTGNIVNNPAKVNSYAQKLTNFNPSIVNQKMIIQQGNLTPGELKLSTALRDEIASSSDSSAWNQQESGPAYDENYPNTGYIQSNELRTGKSSVR